MATANELKSTTRLDQNGNLSGFLLFAKIKCTLAQFGRDQMDIPPAQPCSATWRPRIWSLLSLTSGRTSNSRS